jgi:hypothetical protein
MDQHAQHRFLVEPKARRGGRLARVLSVGGRFPRSIIALPDIAVLATLDFNR